MTSAADRYGKLPETLSQDVRKQVMEAGADLKQKGVTLEGDVAGASKPGPTPPKQSADADVPQRGLSR